MRQQISTLFSTIGNEKPLIHHITNEVTVNDCANATLSHWRLTCYGFKRTGST